MHELLPEGMELRVIEKEENLLSMEIAGEDHTFMNVLKGALLETDEITAATYDMNPDCSGFMSYVAVATPSVSSSALLRTFMNVWSSPAISRASSVSSFSITRRSIPSTGSETRKYVSE